MEINFILDVADMKAFQRHHQRVSPTSRRIRLVALLVFSALSLDAAIEVESDSTAYRVAFFFVSLGLYLMVAGGLTWIVTRIATFRAYRDGARYGVLGERAITLTPEALHERTAVNGSSAAWRGLFRIDETPTHIFIFTQPDGAHVIPRAAFATPAEAETFLATARNYFEAARSADRNR